MKWYDVKKYRPIFGCFYLVVDAAGDASFGRTRADEDGEVIWTDLNYRESKNITHFAIIEPVSIEEEAAPLPMILHQ